MIKEFWQERKEEKLKQKEIKKQNKKLPQTKEQKAYKVFGVLFALFLIFGSIFYTCSGFSGTDDFSWDRLIGITDEMKEKLSSKVEKSSLIQDRELTSNDWESCKIVFNTRDLSIITQEGNIDSNKLLNKSIRLTESMSLDNYKVGALVSNIIKQGTQKSNITLIELNICQEGTQVILRTVMNINLSEVVLSGTLPYVYVTTTSRIEVLNRKLASLDSQVVINDFNEDENAEIIEILNNSSLFGIENYTNDKVVEEINYFAESISANVELSGLNIIFMPK